MFQSESAVFMTKTMLLPSGDHAGFSYCAATAANAQRKATATRHIAHHFRTTLATMPPGATNEVHLRNHLRNCAQCGSRPVCTDRAPVASAHCRRHRGPKGCAQLYRRPVLRFRRTSGCSGKGLRRCHPAIEFRAGLSSQGKEIDCCYQRRVFNSSTESQGCFSLASPTPSHPVGLEPLTASIL